MLVELIAQLTTSVAVRLESFSSYIRLKLLEVTCILSERSSSRSRVDSIEGEQDRLNPSNVTRPKIVSLRV